MRIFVLGGDGFCGWPTSLRLAARGHDVTIIDNLSRRKIDVDLASNSLTDIASIHKRIEIANYFFDNRIKFIQLDVAKEYDKLA